MRRTHLTPLGKLVAMVALLTAGATLGAAGASAVRPHAKEWRCVVVEPGDTLWEIAGKVSDNDPREVVHKITEHNGVHARQLQPGMGIWVPRGDSTVADAPGACPDPA